MAEDDDKVALVRKVNADGTLNMAEAAKATDAKLLYLSTDYVFDGQGTTPWKPDDKNYKPLNVYGQTKLEGELAVARTLEKYFIVRIAWVFGLNGKNFIRLVRRPTPMIWPACWLTWWKQKNTVTTMLPMRKRNRVNISAGMISVWRFINSMVWQQR